MRRMIPLLACLFWAGCAHAQVPPQKWTQNYAPTLADWQAALLYHGTPLHQAIDDEKNRAMAAEQGKLGIANGTAQNLTLSGGTLSSTDAGNALIPAGPFPRALSERAATTLQPQDFLTPGQDVSDLENGKIDIAPIINRMIGAGILSIHIPCGTYQISSTISLLNNVSLLGDGACTILSIRMKDGDVIRGHAVSFTAIRNMTLQADVMRSSGGTITLKDSFENRISDIGFTNGSGKHFTDIYLDGSNGTHVNQVAGRGGVLNGITVTGSDKRSEDTYISNSGFDGYGGSPIELIWSSGNYLSQLDLLGGGNAGIMIDPMGAQEVDGLRAQAVLADSNYGPGWWFAGTGAITETSLTNCWGSTNGIGGGISAGLAVTNRNTDDLVISASEFHANTGTGIDLQEGSNVQISGSTIFMNSTAPSSSFPGINIGYDVNFVTVSGNMTGAGGEARNGAVKSQQGYGIESFIDPTNSRKTAIFFSNMGTGNQKGAFRIPVSDSNPNIISYGNVGQ